MYVPSTIGDICRTYLKKDTAMSQAISGGSAPQFRKTSPERDSDGDAKHTSSPIGGAVEALHHTVSELATRIDVMETRLDPIFRAPEPAVGGTVAATPSHGSSLVVEGLDEAIRRLDGLCSRLAYITSRVEL